MRWMRMVGVVLGLAGAAGLCGCLSVREGMGEIDARVAAGDYAGALEVARGGADAESVNGAFWAESAGTLALMGGNAREAAELLDVADRGFNAVSLRSLGEDVWGTVSAVGVSDCVLPYGPEGLDRVFVSVYRALALGALGDGRGMRVELNRARQRQYEWFYGCSEAIAQEEVRGLDEGEAAWVRARMRRAAEGVARLDAGVACGVTAGGADAGRLFGRLRGFGNAYAAHLTGVVRWCMGDAPLNDLAMAAALAPGNGAAQADYGDERRGARPQNRVWVYVEDGLAPRRVEAAETFSYPSIGGRGAGIGTVSFAVPRLRRRSAAASGYSVNGVALERLADVDALAEDQFDRQWPGILGRQIARTLTRVMSHEVGQAVIYEGTKDQEWWVSVTAGLAYSAVIGLWDLSTNEADLRCAHLLPKTVWMGAVERPAGGVLRLDVAGGTPVEVALPGNGNALVWVRRPVAGAPATVMTIDLDNLRKE